MKKTTAALLSAVLLSGTAGALADDAMKGDAPPEKMKHDGMPRVTAGKAAPGKEAMGTGPATKHAMKREGAKHHEMPGSAMEPAADAMAKDTMAKDTMAKDAMAKDGMAKDGMAKDAMGKHAPGK